MSKLKVRPIDSTKPGSWRAQRTLVKASRRITEAKGAGDGVAMVAALDDIYDLVVDRLYVDDASTTVDAELDGISVEDFQELIAHLTGETVPTTISKS
jgi:hypothetical protein